MGIDCHPLVRRVVSSTRFESAFIFFLRLGLSVAALRRIIYSSVNDVKTRDDSSDRVRKWKAMGKAPRGNLAGAVDGRSEDSIHRKGLF